MPEGFEHGARLARWRSLPRFVRFLIVGGLNTAFGYGAYAALLAVGLHYAAALLLATIAGVCFNFVMTGGLVFDRALRARTMPRFFAAYAVIYAANVALIALLDETGIDAYAAGLLALLPMALLSFFLMRHFVFGALHASD
jgi:putative flippase GtrA